MLKNKHASLVLNGCVWLFGAGFLLLLLRVYKTGHDELETATPAAAVSNAVNGRCLTLKC